MARDLFNNGTIPASHPFVKGHMSEFSRTLPELPEDFMDQFAAITGSSEARENSEEAAIRL